MIQPEPTFVFPVQGQRALISFRPRNTSFENLCAGVIVKQDNGDVTFRSAFDDRKMRSAFRDAGQSLADIAHALCVDAASYWRDHDTLDGWAPPFPGVAVQGLTRFSAMSVGSALDYAMDANSSLSLLLNNLSLKDTSSTTLLKRVAAHWRQQDTRKSLTRFMERTVDFGSGHGSMKIDFWGEHYGCYFTGLSDKARNGAIMVERAIGRIVQLKTLRDMADMPQQTIGLFAELRPQRHELILIGGKTAPKSLWQTERFADKLELPIRVASAAEEAAEMVADQELLAA